VTSLKCDTFFTVVDQVNKRVPVQFHHWETAGSNSDGITNARSPFLFWHACM